VVKVDIYISVKYLYSTLSLLLIKFFSIRPIVKNIYYWNSFQGFM